jgi:HicA toxin of bacterial toxin-antitoxin,
MKASHRKTFEAIFTNPIPKSLEWRRVEALFIALDCEVIEGSGSRVAFRRDNIRADFHRPHPQKEAKSYQVKAAREFLEMLGERP